MAIPVEARSPALRSYYKAHEVRKQRSREYQRAKRRDDPAWVAKRYAADRESRYGVTPARFQELIVQQGNRCAVCRESFTKTPCVDHDHTTGEVRGLLCHHCNKGLGHFKDNPAIILNALDYLDRYLTGTSLHMLQGDSHG